ncbi:uncharacterized protein LOC107264339 [Cephus cinctus]|uniref:Uncharacterized protein LOC107264339 n=1 Tax=Cephus cinctus TaxID=211228 RepID=A0AAJ7FEL9_CEPCN|nr:uncharacterized protein LOC107264339 [Cephus cinctus]
MNRENEEQRPISQTLCGALQKEANCKCLVLSLLIYGCLAAITWCRCANVTKVVINAFRNPIRSTKHVSPCDDGYIYIPVAFMGMLYLVYLVECYHSPTRIDLLHSKSQDSVLSKLSQLRFSQPTIWWKAISYHYVRRKRRITRYRNGDNYTTTQVYYERSNTHAATSFYFYEYCGVRDISKELILDPNTPITKINLTKGFAFSNMRSATEFEEARSRFFAEQEHRDNYMEMREGLDLGYNFNPTNLVAVFGNPWFTNSYVYWCFSALLLSWPLRIIIECNTQYADYQITKLFGVNYDTPSSGEPIHASSSQLSAPGSYMLAPSYSEALLMDPSATGNEDETREMVPSYSEALLYERAEDVTPCEITVERNSNGNDMMVTGCECPCHMIVPGTSVSTISLAEQEEVPVNVIENSEERSQNDLNEVQETLRLIQRSGSISEASVVDNNFANPSNDFDIEIRTCSNCQAGTSTQTINSEILPRILGHNRLNGGCRQVSLETLNSGNAKEIRIQREISEPNLKTDSDLLNSNTLFLRVNGQSLENILEHDEVEGHDMRACSERAEALVLEDEDFLALKSNPSTESSSDSSGQGAIPKRIEMRSRVTVNPMCEVVKKIPSSRTYFCLKSILKQNRRRYTLVTTEELQSLAEGERNRLVFVEDLEIPQRPGTSSDSGSTRGCVELPISDKTRGDHGSRETLDSQQNSRKKQLQRINTSCCLTNEKSENSRVLIFASPIQEVCPSDPFGGKKVVPTENPPDYEGAVNLPVLTRLRRSLTERESPNQRTHNYRKHHRTMSVEPEYLFSENYRQWDQSDYRNSIILPNEGLIPSQGTKILLQTTNRIPINQSTILPDEVAMEQEHFLESNQAISNLPEVASRGKFSRLTRSLTERRTGSRRADHCLHRSFTERVEFARRPGNGRCTNLNMETSL